MKEKVDDKNAAYPSNKYLTREQTKKRGCIPLSNKQKVLFKPFSFQWCLLYLFIKEKAENLVILKVILIISLAF